MIFIGYSIKDTDYDGNNRYGQWSSLFIGGGEAENNTPGEQPIGCHVGNLINGPYGREDQTIPGLVREKKNSSHDTYHGN